MTVHRFSNRDETTFYAYTLNVGMYIWERLAS